jgi:hypothetical protein
MFQDLIATYGTDAASDRLGRFFIDRNNSHGWNSGDTNTRFMASPQAIDQPFVILTNVQQLVNGVCTTVNGISAPVVGVYRAGTWFIDGNGNGTWDGTSQCDKTGSFGSPNDVPTPIGITIGTARKVAPSLNWFFDSDHSMNWSGAPPDTSLTSFGTSDMRAFSSSSFQSIGAQNGRDIFMDLNNNQIFEGSSIDIGILNYLPSTAWTIVGMTRIFRP